MAAFARYGLLTLAFLAGGSATLLSLVMFMAMGANSSPSQELMLKRSCLSVLAVWGLSLAVAVFCISRGLWTPAVLTTALPAVFCVALFVVYYVLGV